MTQSASEFLGVTSLRQLRGIAPDAAPLWGQMTPQHMLEHLVFSMQMSLGEQQLPVVTPPEKLPGALEFLRAGKPMPREVQLPGAEGLADLVYGEFAEAYAALVEITARFLATADPGSRHAHPVFGPLAPSDWVRFHVTHVTHHLAQFGIE